MVGAAGIEPASTRYERVALAAVLNARRPPENRTQLYRLKVGRTNHYARGPSMRDARLIVAVYPGLEPGSAP